MGNIDGLVQERRNSSELAMELCLSCIKSIDMILWSVGAKPNGFAGQGPFHVATNIQILSLRFYLRFSGSMLI